MAGSLAGVLGAVGRSQFDGFVDDYQIGFRGEPREVLQVVGDGARVGAFVCDTMEAVVEQLIVGLGLEQVDLLSDALAFESFEEFLFGSTGVRMGACHDSPLCGSSNVATIS